MSGFLDHKVLGWPDVPYIPVIKATDARALESGDPEREFQELGLFLSLLHETSEREEFEKRLNETAGQARHIQEPETISDILEKLKIV